MICQAILEIKSDAQVSVSGTDIDTCVIDWLDGNPTNITKEEIKNKLTATQYQRDRVYPSIPDQLDMLWHAVDTGDWTAAKVKTTEFYTALKAVKDANPKP